MTAGARERIQRAYGIIEGMTAFSGEKLTERLLNVMVLLEQAMCEDEYEQKETLVFGTPVQGFPEANGESFGGSRRSG